jgi:nicotinic acid phosphoribosyltransferase
VLTVEREIAGVRGEVEQLEGRLRVLTDLTSLSTITLEVQEIAAYQPEQAATFGARRARSFNGSLSSLLAAAEALAVFIAPGRRRGWRCWLSDC